MANSIKLKDLFSIEYGNQLDKNKLIESKLGVNFVSRATSNLGIDSKIEAIPDITPYESGLMTATLGGTYLLSAFVQPEPFYTGQNIKVLRPLKSMTFNEKVFYCLAISKNRFRYTSHGREANKTFDEILVPPFSSLPNWVSAITIPAPEKEPFFTKSMPLDVTSWNVFRYDQIFKIKKGYYNKKLPECEAVKDAVPFIGASENNNGVTSYHRLEDISIYARNGELESVPTTEKKLFPPNGITVANNGASVGSAFFQPKTFTCSHDINPLYLMNKVMSPEIGLFLCAVIAKDRYRWSYGRKWRPTRMAQSTIRLPAHTDGQPDWTFMENYINSLPYSKSI